MSLSIGPLLSGHRRSSLFGFSIPEHKSTKNQHLLILLTQAEPLVPCHLQDGGDNRRVLFPSKEMLHVFSITCKASWKQAVHKLCLLLGYTAKARPNVALFEYQKPHYLAPTTAL